MKDGRLTITQIAETLGVTSKTILRWEKAGKVRRAKRDWRGWRVYTHADLRVLRTFLTAVH